MCTAGVVARKDDKVRSGERWFSPILVVLLVSVLTLFTGGLEAGIAFHTVNNIMAFGIGILTGADLNATSTRLTDVIISIATTLAFAGVRLSGSQAVPSGSGLRIHRA